MKTAERYGREPGLKKIAVLRANALGNFIVTLPALESLRAAYPTAEIVLLATRWHAAFLAGRPGPVDRVVVIAQAPGVSVDLEAVVDEAELDEFFTAMVHERFDLAVQMHGGGALLQPLRETPRCAPVDRAQVA